MTTQANGSYKLDRPFSNNWAELAQRLDQRLLDQFDVKAKGPNPWGDWDKETWSDKDVPWDNWEKQH